MSETKGYNRLLVFFIVCAFGMLAIGILVFMEPGKEATSVEGIKPDLGMPVSVIEVNPQTYPAVIHALGEAVPLWQTTLKSQVDGAIVFLSDNLHTGQIVRKGELLLQLEKSHYMLQLAEAESRVAASRVSLLVEEQEAQDARKNWEQAGIGGSPSSPLVLRSPHLKAAQKDMEAAKASLDFATTQLGYTDIKAPYDGVVMQRFVNPGHTLLAGEEVVTLYALSSIEVGIKLDQTQWKLLPDSKKQAKVTITDRELGATWIGRIDRSARHISSDSRLRALFIRVDQPLDKSPPLLPGAFVKVTLVGKEVENLLEIPEPALTKQGLVWFVDEHDRLYSLRCEPVFYGEGVVYITRPDSGAGNLRVVTAPNSSFINGLLVVPNIDSSGG